MLYQHQSSNCQLITVTVLGRQVVFGHASISTRSEMKHQILEQLWDAQKVHLSLLGAARRFSNPQMINILYITIYTFWGCILSPPDVDILWRLPPLFFLFFLDKMSEMVSEGECVLNKSHNLLVLKWFFFNWLVI